jgi:dienelactone hydrolase
MIRFGKTLLLTWLGASAWVCAAQVQPLAGTAPLTMQGDLASNMVAGIDQFLLRKTDESVGGRAQNWRRDFSSPQAYAESLAANRARLAYILGVADPRAAHVDLQLMASPTQPALCGRGSGYEVYAVRWPAFGDVTGEGLLLTPVGRAPVANVIAIPDADQTPEQLAGLTPGIASASQFARRLAESGCRVIVPVLISRHIDPQWQLSNRELIYRPAYELGRNVMGYEVEKVQAAIDWLTAQNGDTGIKTGVIGWGEGGLVAQYTAALDPRVAAVCVSGYFDDRRKMWQEPIDRNVFGLLEEFGDAELAAMVAPRGFIVEAAQGPEVTMPGGGCYTPQQVGFGAPGVIVSPRLADVRAEFERARGLVSGLNPAPLLQLVVSGDGGDGPFGSGPALSALLNALAGQAKLAPAGAAPEKLWADFDAAGRQAEQLHELDRHNQWLLAKSPYARQQFMTIETGIGTIPVAEDPYLKQWFTNKMDFSSPEKFRESAEKYREFFYHDVLGRFDDAMLPANPRSRVIYDEPKWTGYGVMLDVYPDVFAYGILLVPKDLKPGERRPVVVCQHGLEGRPEDVIAGNSQYYHDFAATLCEQGFITFAPQNPYTGVDRFRTLQRKSNPLGKCLFSIIVPQHQQITDWLKTLPFVDPARIGFYGLSYGGKTAVRVPALVTNYCLSICSGDFNNWVWKCASTLSPYSYVRSPEYDMDEFNLGSTFNYSEMTALIAPRPFMVERGHFDVVSSDEEVAYEFAKTRHLYEARLELHDQCAIEWFTGPHSIHGVGTFNFLHEHLNWPAAGASH